MMSGLWAQRFFQQFLGDMSTENFGKGITFEQFLLLNYQYLRAGPESMDRMIFEIFDLSGNDAISEADLSSMLLTLPPQALISGLNSEKANQKTSKYQYRVIKAPQGYTYIHRNKKLLMRVEDQETLSKMDFMDDNEERKGGKTQVKSGNAAKRTQSMNTEAKANNKLALSAKTNDMPGSQKVSMGLYEFKTLLTNQANEISKHMIESSKAFFASKHGQYEASSFQDDSALDFDQFRVFLDLNPYLRTMFLEALNPQMWAIDPIGKTLPKSLYNEGTILDIAVET